MLRPPASDARSLTLALPDTAATEALARAMSPGLRPGDVLALTGPIGAGKSTFARALIKHRLALEGRDEDVPSPTFTLVQSYECADGEIWHCDLYRLTSPDEILELGLDSAFDEALSLIEWPDRLGPDLPDRALHLALTPAPDSDARRARLTWSDPNWAPRLGEILAQASDIVKESFHV